jgi:hypothetical protein
MRTAIIAAIVFAVFRSEESDGRSERYQSCERLPPVPLPDQLVILTTPLEEIAAATKADPHLRSTDGAMARDLGSARIGQAAALPAREK